MTFIDRSSARSRWWALLAILAVVGLLVSLTPRAFADHGAVPGPPGPNPPFPEDCGIDVAVVLDTSNSIFNDSPANPGIMKDAAKAFVDALAGTPSRVGIYSFQTNATLELGLTSVQTAAGADQVKAAVDGVVFGESSPTGGTNWEDGFLVASGQGADLVAFATDGNPTTHNGDGDPGIPPGEPEDLAAGIEAANVVKGEGSRIVGIGIGGDINVANLELISGPNVDDDYYLPANFAAFEATLQEIASRLCAPAVIATKLVGDGAGNFSLGSGWDFDLAVQPAVPVDVTPADGVTGAEGSATFTWDAAGTSSVELTEVGQTGFTLESAACELPDGTPVATTPIPGGLSFSVELEAIVKCEFRNVPALGAIEVVKTPSTTIAQVGDTVTYDYVVTNTGGVPLSDVTLDDDVLGPITLAATMLAPGESTTGTADYVVAESDLPGPIVNVATASGTDPAGAVLTDEDTATVDLAAIEVVKTSDAVAAEIGDTITYTYVVTNLGSVTLTDVTVVDDVLGPITLAATTLAPGESTTGTATYVVTEDDLPGPIVNVAVATGTAPDGSEVSDEDDETVAISGQPGIEVVKVADPQIAQVGETVTYSYTVTNTGAVTLTAVTVDDDVLGPITLAATTLSPGQSTTGTATYTVTQADLPGPIVNVAVATGTDPTGAVVTDEDDESVGIAGLEIVKTSDAVEADVGDTITYTYTVTNVGSVTLSNITVVDDVLGPITLAATTLAPGESTTGTATYTVTEDDLPGPIVNVAVATGETPDGDEVSDEDDETVAISGQPGIEVVKVADPQIAQVGETVTYSYTVTNTGSVTLTDVTLDDDVLGPITPAATTLVPGESTTGTATYTVTADDLPGPIINVATATGTDPTGATVTDEDDESVGIAGLEIVKTSDAVLAEVGDVITYTYTVTNIGSVTLTNITVEDDVLGPITLAATTLAPGESTTGTATYTVVEGDIPGAIVNVAVATGETPDGDEVSDEDDAIVPTLQVLPTTITTAPPQTLPKTGADSDRTAGAALSMILLGVLLLLLAASPFAHRYATGQPVLMRPGWATLPAPLARAQRHRRGFPVLDRMPRRSGSGDTTTW